MTGIMCACICVYSLKASCDRYNMTGIMCACIYALNLAYNMTGIMCVLAFM